jgi:hypothetical protein
MDRMTVSSGARSRITMSQIALEVYIEIIVNKDITHAGNGFPVNSVRGSFHAESILRTDSQST